MVYNRYDKHHHLASAPCQFGGRHRKEALGGLAPNQAIAQNAAMHIKTCGKIWKEIDNREALLSHMCKTN
jgi:hypothetical protein